MYMQSKKTQAKYRIIQLILAIFYGSPVALGIVPTKSNQPKSIADYKTVKKSHIQKSSVKKDVMCCGAGIICLLLASYTAMCTKDQYYVYQSLSKQEFDKPEQSRNSLLTNISSKMFSNKKDSKESNVVYQQLIAKKQNDMLDSCMKSLILGCGTVVLMYAGSRLLSKGLQVKM